MAVWAWAVCTAVVQSGRCLERDHMEPQEGPKKGSCHVQSSGTSLFHNLDFGFVFSENYLWFMENHVMGTWLLNRLLQQFEGWGDFLV